MRTTITTPLIALVAVALTACAGEPEDGAVAPAPTVTETVTVTADPGPEPADSEEPSEPAPTATATAAGDACAASGLDSQAFIFVTAPAAGASFASGDPVEGCANVFEAAYSWEVLDASQTVLDSGNGTASCGTGCVGTFSFTPSFTVSSTQVGAVRVFASSAQDGSDVHVNLIPVLLQP